MSETPGYVKLRRGLRDHLPELSSRAVKLYVALLIEANHQTGVCRTRLVDLCGLSGLSYKTTIRAIAELESKNPNPFISVSREGNRLGPLDFTILRFKGSGNLGAGSSLSDTGSSLSDTGSSLFPTEASLSSNKDNNLQAPKKRREENIAHFDVWWKLYPRRVAKDSARKAFRAIAKKPTDLGTLMQTTPAWAFELSKREMEYRPYPATFLRAGAWRLPPETSEPEDKPNQGKVLICSACRKDPNLCACPGGVQGLEVIQVDPGDPRGGVNRS
jgi:hypothetical protein